MYEEAKGMRQNTKKKTSKKKRKDIQSVKDEALQVTTRQNNSNKNWHSCPYFFLSFYDSMACEMGERRGEGNDGT